MEIPKEFPSHSLLLTSLYENVRKTPEKPALIFTDGTPVTYSELWEEVGKAAVRLQSLAEAGQNIMLAGDKSKDFVIWYLAAHAAGVRAVIVDAKTNAAHLDHYITTTSPVALFGLEQDGISQLPAIVELAETPGWETYKAPEITDREPADIMFTSGTTGEPKGVMLSHRNIYASATNINLFIGNTAEDTELIGLPLVHSFGLGRLRCNLIKGATVVLHDGFGNLPKVFAAIEKYGVTGFGMVPAVWNYIVRFSGERIARFADRIRYIEIGSAAMPEEEKERLMRLFPDTRICMHYGLTEASRSLFTEFHSAPNLRTIGTSANPSEVEVGIFDETGHPVDDGEEGELCVKGNMVISSYLNPAQNADAFFGDWFRTGDWGSRDKDGLFYLASRKKDLINVGGKKVSPVEIEDVLEKIGVGESMCVAIPDPKGVLGSVPKVLLVKGTFTKPLEQIREELRGVLEPYKFPAGFEVVDSIPKTPNGKKKRTI